MCIVDDSFVQGPGTNLIHSCRWFWIAHTQPFFTARKKQHQEQFLHFALPCKLRSSPPITLVLDLDETLVHCSTNGLSIDPDVTFDVDFGGKVYKVSGCLRPHVKEFLATVSETFEVRTRDDNYTFEGKYSLF